MIRLSSDNNNNILVINYDNTMTNHICVIESLPDDFYKYLSEGKYLANASGLYVKPGWVDYDMLEIPQNPLIDYIMISECPKDANLTRHVYWEGEKHEVDSSFTIYLIVLHFNADGSRNRQYDCKTWTRADKGTMIDNPFDTGTQVDEYDLFRDMINSVYMPQIMQYGIYSAEGTLNNRIYAN